MTVRVYFDITDAQYRALLPEVTAAGLTLNGYAHRLLADRAEARILAADGHAPRVNRAIAANPDLYRRLRELAAEGHTRAEAAELVGVSLRTVARLTEQAGGIRWRPNRRHRFTADELATVRTMYTDGATIAEMARAIDSTVGRARAAMDHCGLKSLGPGNRPAARRRELIAAMTEEAAA